MPSTCPLAIRSLTPDAFDELDYRVMGHAFAAQNELGRLCEEGPYQRDLQARLRADGFQDVQIEVPIHVSHADFSKTYYLDLVADHAVYELKTVAALTNEHTAQLLNYLFLLGIHRGKLINFRPPQVQGRIHATGLSAEKRHEFQFDTSRWQDLTPQCATLGTMMHDLLADWGAFLDFNLYEQALTHFLGGELRVVQRLPLRRQSIALGNQTFHVHAPGAAFQVSAVTDHVAATEEHLRRLLALTELRSLQWINLCQAEVGLVTLLR
jgi:GxxExxY protein